MNIHVDTSFPCSLQGARQGWEGGWTVDFNNETNGCPSAGDTENYSLIFTSQDMSPQLNDVGWFR